MVGLTGAGRPLRATAVLAIAAILGLVVAPNALAGTFDVNSTADAALGGSVTCAGPGSDCTLRAAVQAADAAGGASTITLPAGKYTLAIPAPAGAAGSDADDPASGDLDVDNNAAISIVGSGAGTTVVDAGGIDRVFAVQTGAGLALSALTVEGGIPAAQSSATQEGGAIYTDGTLSTTDVNFTANGALSDGGAIYADTESRLSVSGGSFTGNGGSFTGNPTAYGGAIEDASMNPAEIADAAFSQNTASDAGGDIYFWGSGALTVSNSNFSDTVGHGTGGAISASGTGQLSVTGSRFTGDSSSSGGAIFSSGPISLTTDSFTDDTATDSSYGTGGGALYMQGASATQTLVQDQFSDDSASVYGGAIYTDGGALDMAQSSIVGSGALYGAGVYLGSDSALLEDDTIAENSAMQGGALYLLAAAPLSLVNDTIAQNTAADGGGGGIFGAASAVVGSGEGIVNTVIADNVGGDCDSFLPSSVVTGYDMDSDSSCLHGLSAAGLQVGVQPALAAPADNGGPVLTMLEQAGSPTLGAGDGAYCPSADARTVARDPSSCDLGAYQAISTGLTASLTAPASAATAAIFSIKVTAINEGPGTASNLTLTDQLPAGATLAGEQPSGGTCTVSGTPAELTCDLGTVAGGTSASVTLFVSSAVVGAFSDTATLGDDQGGAASADATTQLTSTTDAPATAPTTAAPATAAPTTAAPASPIPSTTAKPTVSRAEILQITSTAATLRAHLDPGGNTVSYFFQYGPTPQFGRTTRLTVTSRSGVRSARVVGLRAGRRYYFRLLATSGSVVAHEPTYSFVTADPKPKPHPKPTQHPKPTPQPKPKPKTHKKPTRSIRR